LKKAEKEALLNKKTEEEHKKAQALSLLALLAQKYRY
jgi:hypothetical protein